MNVIAEISPTDLDRVLLGRHKQWTHEATRLKDGARLYTSVSYRGCTKGDWEAALLLPNGELHRLDRVPAIRLSTKVWGLTPFGVGVREEGRD